VCVGGVEIVAVYEQLLVACMTDVYCVCLCSSDSGDVWIAVSTVHDSSMLVVVAVVVVLSVAFTTSCRSLTNSSSNRTAVL
jgi:hypothetical protein